MSPSDLFLSFQFRDFLQLYNKLTETCFLHCSESFFNRNLTQDEVSDEISDKRLLPIISTFTQTNCVDKCVIKFSNVNQKVMGLYVEAQTAINTRRMAELEIQLKQQEAQVALQQQQQNMNENVADVAVNPVQVTI